MSSVDENVMLASVSSQDVAVSTPVKREKKPVLPVKLLKFASTIYFILQRLREDGLMTEEAFERAVTEQFHLCDPATHLEQQTHILQTLLDQQPAALKDFRKVVIARNKPPKAPKAPKAPKEPKEKKEKAPKEKVVKDPKAKKETVPVTASADQPTPTPETKQKKVRKAKVAVADTETMAQVPIIVDIRLVEEVIEETQSLPIAPDPIVPVGDTKTSKNTPKTPKPKTKTETEKPVKESKTKKGGKNSPKVTSDASQDLIGQIVAAARSSSSEVSQSHEILHEDQEEEDDEDEIQTREFSFGGDLYLIDQDNSLYSYSSHEHIGTFDPSSNSISLL